MAETESNTTVDMAVLKTKMDTLDKTISSLEASVKGSFDKVENRVKELTDKLQGEFVTKETHKALAIRVGEIEVKVSSHDRWQTRAMVWVTVLTGFFGVIMTIFYIILSKVIDKVI